MGICRDVLGVYWDILGIIEGYVRLHGDMWEIWGCVGKFTGIYWGVL